MQQSVKSLAYQTGGSSVIVTVLGVVFMFLDPDGGTQMMLLAIFFGLAALSTMSALLIIDRRLNALESPKTDEITGV